MDRVWVGMDVGKEFHWAHVLDASGTELLSRRVENDEADLLELIDAVLSFAGEALWAVDQPGGGKLVKAFYLDAAGANMEIRYGLRGLAPLLSRSVGRLGAAAVETPPRRAASGETSSGATRSRSSSSTCARSESRRRAARAASSSSRARRWRG